MHFRSRSVLCAALVVSLAAASAQTPGAPSGLSATINADSSLTLQWTAPPTGRAAERIRRADWDKRQCQ